MSTTIHRARTRPDPPTPGRPQLRSWTATDRLRAVRTSPKLDSHTRRIWGRNSLSRRLRGRRLFARVRRSVAACRTRSRTDGAIDATRAQHSGPGDPKVGTVVIDERLVHHSGVGGRAPSMREIRRTASPQDRHSNHQPQLPVGDPGDNALAESVIGLYKIRAQSTNALPGRTLDPSRARRTSICVDWSQTNSRTFPNLSETDSRTTPRRRLNPRCSEHQPSPASWTPVKHSPANTRIGSRSSEKVNSIISQQEGCSPRQESV